MLLRILALLLLCLSSGMCATLAHYRIQAQEDNSPTEIPVLDTVSAAAAAAEAPEVEPVVIDAIVADTPVAEALAEDKQVADEPVVETLADDKPVADEPEAEADIETADVPLADAPAAEDPIADNLVAEDPVADNLVAEDPVADSPATAEEPLADSLDADEPAAEDPVVINLVAEDPVADSLVSEDPVANNLVAEDPVADNLVAEDPVANNLVAEDPVVDSAAAAKEPAVESPVADVAEVPAPDTDAMMGDIHDADAPATDSLTEEALAQEVPAEEELGNDIEAVLENQQDNDLAVSSAEEEESSWGLGMLRGGFQSVSGYFDSLVELVGGRSGVCQYRCRQGETPEPRPGYQIPEPNGCSSSLIGFQFDLGIPAMTKCCDQLDTCYDTCGISKYRCDSKFRWCLHGICSDVKKTLGFESKVQACETLADTLHSTLETLGCRPYLDSQRAACVCDGEERDEL